MKIFSPPSFLSTNPKYRYTDGNINTYINAVIDALGGCRNMTDQSSVFLLRDKFGKENNTYYEVRYGNAGQDPIIRDFKTHSTSLKSLYESLGHEPNHYKSQLTEDKALIKRKDTDNKHDEQDQKSEIKIKKDFSL